MAARKRLLLKCVLPVLLAALLWLLHPLWMTALGSYLVSGEEPAQGDIAVVLAGDYSGHRVIQGAEMVRRGFTGKVLVSGPEGMYGYNEAELAIPLAVRSGYPEFWFIPFPNRSLSTRQEAAAIVPELRRRNVRRCLLVTSNFHTRRAGRLFRAAAPDLEFRVIAAPDVAFRPDQWWHTREGQKRFVMEWMKTVSGWFGV